MLGLRCSVYDMIEGVSRELLVNNEITYQPQPNFFQSSVVTFTSSVHSDSSIPYLGISNQ